MQDGKGIVNAEGRHEEGRLKIQEALGASQGHPAAHALQHPCGEAYMGWMARYILIHNKRH